MSKEKLQQAVKGVSEGAAVQAATAAVQAPAPPAGAKRRYRVTLPGVRPLVLNEEKGTREHREYLDVEATSEGDAFEQFRRYNGILSTTQQPKVEPID